MSKPSPRPQVGTLLRDWRRRRRLSQLHLALDSNVSSRHLSFVETGRAQPSRAMLLRLADHLAIPLRERNALLAAAGFAPIYAEHPLSHPAMTPARVAIEKILEGHAPYPALVVDRHWNLLMANAALQAFLVGVDESLLQPPVNVLRLSLHPKGLAPRIANLATWRAHILTRLQRQTVVTGDPVLARLLTELSGYPGGDETAPAEEEFGGIAVPLRIATPQGVLSLIGTTTVFGTPTDLTLAEIVLETFFPADEATAKAFREKAGSELSL
jgi:transcriptional regulator with XRE-family HTH domain